MRRVPVYRAEKEAGLAEAVRACGRVAVASVARPAEALAVPERLAQRLAGRCQGEFNERTLFPLKSVLVTSGWNRNDHVFERGQLWAARHTPEDNPFNYEHDSSDIIGHITANYCVDEQGSLVAEDTSEEDLPAKYHVVTPAVLYRLWDEPGRQERMDKILAELPEGKWFVSMECLFDDFDYAVVTAAGEQKVVARNSETAFLTKHLKVFGGSGKYEGARVGMLLKGIVFCGKGLVRNPANPDSVILSASEIEPFGAPREKICANFSEAVYSPTEAAPAATPESEETMKENETLQSKLTEAEAAKAKADADLAQARADAEKAQAEVAKAKQEAEQARAELAAANEARARLEADLKSANDAVAALQADKRHADRLALVKGKLGIEGDKAEKLVKASEAASDEAFAAQLEALAELAPKAEAAKEAPKSTPAKEAPKSTPAKKAPKSTAAKQAEAAEQALEGAEAEAADADLAVGADDDEVDELTKEVVEYFSLANDGK
jgi:hypothetical protein